MLKLRHLIQNFALAKEALQHWEHDPDTLEEDLNQFRISSNAIYPFHQEGRLCFLRLAPREEKLQTNIAGEFEFLSYLIRNGYPALEPILARSGAPYLLLHTAWGEYYAAAFYGVKGVQLTSTQLTDAVLYQYGKALGRLHAVSASFVPTIKKWSHTDALSWIESVLIEYDAPAFMLVELRAVSDLLAELTIDHKNYGLVHYDFEPDNVFYDVGTQSCSVIDFDDGMYHWYALDIEQVFDSLMDCVANDELQAAKKMFIKGYRSEYAFDQQAENLLPLMRRFVDLFTYARLIRSVAESLAEEPQWMHSLRQKLNWVIHRLESKIKA